MMLVCNYSVSAGTSLLQGISSGKCREYIHGRYRRPASHDTDTSMYGVGEDLASAAHGCANAVIAWMHRNDRASDVSCRYTP